MIIPKLAFLLVLVCSIPVFHAYGQLDDKPAQGVLRSGIVGAKLLDAYFGTSTANRTSFPPDAYHRIAVDFRAGRCQTVHTTIFARTICGRATSRVEGSALVRNWRGRAIFGLDQALDCRGLEAGPGCLLERSTAWPLENLVGQWQSPQRDRVQRR